MYKDVCKRILAVAVVICMVVTLVEWPTPVVAQEAPSYHIYQYAGTESADFADADVASAVFMTGQNASGGAEIFAGVSFDVHMENEAEAENTKAVVELYTSPTPGNPGSGYFVASSEIYGLTEGTNNISFAAASPKLMRGECFSVILSLEGNGLSFYTDVYSDVQRTFTKQADGTWRDMGESGQAVALRAVTFDERMVEPQNTSFADRIARALSANVSDGEPVDEIGEMNGAAEKTESGDTLISETTGSGSETGSTLTGETTGSGTGSTLTGETDGSGTDSAMTGGVAGTAGTGSETDSTLTGETAGTGSETDSMTGGTAGSGTDSTLTGGTAGNVAEDVPANDEPGIPPVNMEADTAVTVDLSPKTCTLGIGAEKELEVLVSPIGTVVTNYAWWADNPEVAEIEPNGVGATANVKAKAKGTTNVNVTVSYGASETKTLTCAVTVNENIENFRTVPETLPACIYNGKGQTPEIEVYAGDTKLVNGQDYNISYENNVEATLNGTKAKVKIAAIGTYSGMLEREFVIEPMELKAENVKPEEMLSEDIKTAEDVEAKIKVSGAQGTPLEKDKDYTLELKDENPATAGVHTAVITGIGNYTGSVELEYVVKTQVADFEIVVSEEKNGFIYTHQEIRPAVEVYEKNGEERGERIAPENYTVTYDNNINATLDESNPAKITVTGIGNYYGSAEATFRIEPKNIANTDDDKIPVTIPTELPVAARPSVEGADAVPEFDVLHNDRVLEKGIDYEITSVSYTDGEGNVTPVAKAAKATFTIKGIGNYQGTVERSCQIGEDIQNVIASVSVDNTGNAIYSGKEICPNVTVTSLAGTILAENTDYTVEYKNNVNAGTAEVYVRGIGNYGGVYINTVLTPACSATFEIQPYDVENLTYNYDKTVTYSPNKEEMKPSVKVSFNGQTLEEDEDYTLELPADGELAVGNATAITVEGKGNFEGTKILLYDIKPCQLENKTGSSLPIVLSMVREHTYTGKKIDPEITLKYIDKNGAEYLLRENRDYTIQSYEKIKAGTWPVIIDGMGNYDGFISDNITISGISIKNVIVSIPENEKYDAEDYSGDYQAFKKYTGKDICFDNMTVTYNGTTLEKDVDYEISYDNNRDMSKAGGSASFTIKGVEGGSYYGFATYPFLIYKELDADWVSGVKDKTYTGEPIELPIIVKESLLSNKLVENVDYRIEYKGKHEDVTTADAPEVVTIKAMDNLPTQNGCYHGTVEIKFAITPLDLNKIEKLTYTVKDKVYEGVPVTLNPQDVQMEYPKPSGLGMKELTGGTDFTIGTKYNKNEGVTTADDLASTTVNGIGNFTGSKTVKFAISGKSIADAEVTLTDADKAPKYTGKEIETKPIVTDAGQTLTEGIHYQLSWENNVNAGNATVIVEGIGNYSGTKSVPFKILPLDISNTTTDGTIEVTGIEPSYTFTGMDIEPNPTVKFTRTSEATPVTLVKGTDYNVTCRNNRNQTNGVSSAVVAIEGQGNYTGTLEKSFEIIQKAITDTDVKIADIPPQPFTGMQITPSVTVTCGDYTLVEKEDYTLSYVNNTALGANATVTITGKGNFSGTATKKFSITQSITSTDIVVICDAVGKSFTYTGKAVEPEVVVMNQLGNVKLVRGTDYEIDYYNNTTGKDGDNVNAGEISLIIRGINTYAGKREPISFKIIPKNIGDTDVAATLSEKNFTYTGSPMVPKVTASYNGMTLAETEYSLVYSNNTNAGVETAKVTLSANGGNYIGTKEVLFTIAPKSIGAGNAFTSEFEMEPLQAEGFTGNPICPTPKIYRKNADGSKTPLLYGDGADYTLGYENNTAVGNASMIVTGTGNYTGTVTKTFEIKGGLTDAVISLAGVAEDGTISYEKGTLKGDIRVVEPVPTVTLNGKTLKNGTDYTVSYEGNDFVGTAKVLITGAGNYGGTISKEFTIFGELAKAEVAPIDRQTYTGDVITPNPTVTYYGKVLQEGTDYIRSYADNIEIGMNAKLIISGSGNFKGTQSVTFQIDPADGKFVVAEIPVQKYCGLQITPEVTVSFGGNELLKGTDYTVSYGTNRDAGQGTVTITGKNSYKDIETVVKSFTISPLEVNELKLTDPENDDPVFTGIAAKEYTGTAITPKIKLSYEVEGKKTYELTANDYTISIPEGYENVEVGEAAIVITGKGKNVYGDRTEKFTITQKDINNKPVTVTVAGSSSYIYSGTQICPEVTVKNGTIVLQKDVDYFVDYGENTQAGPKAGTIIIQGNGNYMGSRTVEFKIGQLSVASASIKVSDIPEQNYTGSAVKPPVTVTHTLADGNEYVLVENVDYTLTYTSNTNAGKSARVTIAGKGNYTGSKSATFTIIGHDIASTDVVLTDIPNQAYTGKALTPAVVLTHGTYTLKRGTDYDLTYADNKELGTATVTITGKGNYPGKRTAEFKVVANDISTAKVEMPKNTTWIYTGEEVRPTEISVKIGSTELELDRDYKLEYKNNIKAGTATIVVNGAGEYGGSQEITFQIERKDITEKEVVLSGFKESVAYTGEEVKQNITLTYGENTLVEETDYTVSYTGNTAIGKASMTITGSGNYTGTLEKTFEISQKQIFDENLIVKELSSTYTYTGEAIEPKPVLSINDVTLIEGKDYTISYENNIDAGVAAMTIEGTGNYAGTKELTFDILRKSIQLGTFSSIGTQLYTGKEIRPEVSVSDGKALALGTDYSLIYENNRNAGTATAVVAGMKNYTAVQTLRFDIRPGDAGGLVVTGYSDAAISLGWNAGGVVTGYEVYRAEADGRYQKIARVRGTSYTDRQLTADAEYTYKVRAYLVTENETYYSAFSSVVNGKL